MPREPLLFAFQGSSSIPCSDRISALRFAANQLRLLFSAFVSILVATLRCALLGTRLACATAGTLRLKLLKIAARVTVSVRRV